MFEKEGVQVLVLLKDILWKNTIARWLVPKIKAQPKN